jgi:hypothetical protein
VCQGTSNQKLDFKYGGGTKALSLFLLFMLLLHLWRILVVETTTTILNWGPAISGKEEQDVSINTAPILIILQLPFQTHN